MIVWRVETANHDGPFQSRGGFIGLSRAMTKNGEDVWVSTKNHPDWSVDFSWHNDTSMYYFGCDSFQQLKHWFGMIKTIEYLRNHSFRIAKYECETNQVIIGHSGLQLIFNMAASIAKQFFDMGVLLNEEEPAA